MSILPFRKKKNEGMTKKNQYSRVEKEQVSGQPQRNEKPLKKSIILPAYVWESLEKEAKEQRRTVAKQTEVILIAYFNLEPGLFKSEKDTLIGYA